MVYGGTHSVGIPEYAVIQARVQLVEEAGMKVVKVPGFLVEKIALGEEVL